MEQESVFTACRQGDTRSLSQLIRRGRPIDGHNNDGFFPIHVCSHLGNVNCLRLIIRAMHKRRNRISVTVDTRTHAGTTALMLAAAGGNRPCVLLLFRHSADCTLLDNDGMSALHMALTSHSQLIARDLLEYGANQLAHSPTSSGSLPLYLEQSVCPELLEPVLTTALLASTSSHLIDQLVCHGASVRARCVCDPCHTPIMIAVRLLRLDVLQVFAQHSLLNANSVNIRDSHDHTCLYYMDDQAESMCENRAILALLIRSGLDVLSSPNTVKDICKKCHVLDVLFDTITVEDFTNICHEKFDEILVEFDVKLLNILLKYGVLQYASKHSLFHSVRFCQQVLLMSCLTTKYARLFQTFICDIHFSSYFRINATGIFNEWIEFPFPINYPKDYVDGHMFVSMLWQIYSQMKITLAHQLVVEADWLIILANQLYEQLTLRDHLIETSSTAKPQCLLVLIVFMCTQIYLRFDAPLIRVFVAMSQQFNTHRLAESTRLLLELCDLLHIHDTPEPLRKIRCQPVSSLIDASRMSILRQIHSVRQCTGLSALRAIQQLGRQNGQLVELILLQGSAHFKHTLSTFIYALAKCV